MGRSECSQQAFRYWTRVYEAPETYLLNVEGLNPKHAYTNCYLLHDGDDWLVVDTMLHSIEGCERMLAALDELEAAPGHLSLFLTHAHADHTGLSSAFSGREAKIYIGRDELTPYSSRALSYCLDTVLPKAFAEGFVGEEASYFAELRRIMSPDIVVGDCAVVPVDDGARIALGVRVLEVVGTPGHAPGHVSLFDCEAGVLFGGDLALEHTAPFIDVSFDGDDSVAAYMDSMQKVLSLPVRAFFPSHDGGMLDAASRIEWLIDHHRERLNEAVNVIAENPNASGAEVIRSLSWSPVTSTWEAVPLMKRGFIMCEGMAVLDHLVAQGEVSRIADADGVFRYRRRIRHQLALAG